MNIQNYSIALFTTFEKNKTTSSVAEEIGINQCSASRFLKSMSIHSSDLVQYINGLFGNKPLNLVIDDFVLSRRYSQETEGTSSMIDQSTKSFTNGINIVGAGLTDGKYFLPLDLEQWIAEFIAGDQYLKKAELAEKIIVRIMKLGIKINCYVLDGLYFSEDFINFLNDNKLNFVIKAKTTTKVLLNGEKIQLQNCKELRLNMNQNQKTIKASWCDKNWYFVAVRRQGKRGEKIIYLITNFRAKSKKYAKVYDSRWTIEKFIRTGKQYLGLKDSRSQEAAVYLNHIRCVFFAYMILQFIVKKLKLDSVEEAIDRIQAWKFKLDFAQINDRVSLFMKSA